MVSFCWCTGKRENADRRAPCEILVCMYANYAKEQECLRDVVKLWGPSTPICTLMKSPHSKTGLKKICSTYIFLYTHFFLSQKTLNEKFQKFDCDQMIHLEHISRLMSLVNVTTMQGGCWRNQPIMCPASSPPLTKIGGHKDSAAALHPTLLQMPLPLLRNSEGGLQISPKALFTTINIGSWY